MRKTTTLILTILFSLLMTSCGSNSTKPSKDAARNDSVSGSASSGTALQEAGSQAENMIHRFANSTNFYLPSDKAVYIYNDPDHPYNGFRGFISYLKDDVTKTEKTKIDHFDFLFSVTDEGVYYYKEDNTLWRIPIEKNSQGTDTIKLEKQEKVLSESEGIMEGSGGFINDSCIVYATYKGGAIKYDRNTGKKDRHSLYGNITSLVPVSESCLIVCNMYSGYYLWEIDTDQWTQFSNNGDATDDPYAAGEDSFFHAVSYGSEEEIYRYKLGAGKDQRLFSDKQISKACQSYVDKKGGKYQSFALWQLFYYKDHLYVEAQVDWTRKKEFRMNYVIFEADLTTTPKLRICEELMDYFEKESDDKSIKEKIDENDKVVWNAANAMYLTDGKINMIMQGPKDIEVHCFDLEKNTGRKVTEKDPNYYLPYYNLPWKEVYDELVMEGGMNFVPEELESFWEDC